MKNANINTAKLVENIVFCNAKKEILSFQQFATPLPNNEVNPVLLYTEPFKNAIIQFTDGTARTYKYKTTTPPLHKAA